LPVAPPLLVMIGLSMLGNSSLVVQPMVVGALVDHLGFTERQAGFTASVELAGLSLGMLLLVGVARHISRRRLASFAIATVVVTSVMSCFVHQFETMLLVRFLAGIGGAMAFAVFLTMAASSERPVKVFAIVNAVSIAYSGVFTPFAPMILQWWGVPGLFIVIATVASLMILLISGVPSYASTERSRGVAASHGGMAPLAGAIAMLLIMMLLLYTGHGAIWAFQERIGVGLGLSSQSAGTWIGMSMLIGGVGGSLLAGWLGLRLGRVLPQLISLGLSCVGAMLLVTGATHLLFGLACALVAMSWFYGLPYQMGLLATFDPHGRANMAGLVMTTGGAALGPAVAATLIDGSGHAAIGVFAAACYLVCLLLVLPPALRVKHATALTVN
jgi:predicted MFS family arabinose efflux permease